MGQKSNCKRPAGDKLVSGDSKRLLPDVNEYTMHFLNAMIFNDIITGKVCVLIYLFAFARVPRFKYPNLMRLVGVKF